MVELGREISLATHQIERAGLIADRRFALGSLGNDRSGRLHPVRRKAAFDRRQSRHDRARSRRPRRWAHQRSSREAESGSPDVEGRFRSPQMDRHLDRALVWSSISWDGSAAVVATSPYSGTLLLRRAFAKGVRDNRCCAHLERIELGSGLLFRFAGRRRSFGPRGSGLFVEHRGHRAFRLRRGSRAPPPPAAIATGGLEADRGPSPVMMSRCSRLLPTCTSSPVLQLPLVDLLAIDERTRRGNRGR